LDLYYPKTASNKCVRNLYLNKDIKQEICLHSITFSVRHTVFTVLHATFKSVGLRSYGPRTRRNTQTNNKTEKESKIVYFASVQNNNTFLF